MIRFLKSPVTSNKKSEIIMELFHYLSDNLQFPVFVPGEIQEICNEFGNGTVASALGNLLDVHKFKQGRRPIGPARAARRRRKL